MMKQMKKKNSLIYGQATDFDEKQSQKQKCAQINFYKQKTVMLLQKIFQNSSY